MQNPPSQRGLYGQRPSKSADPARRAEFARIAAMTPTERMLKALELGDRRKLFAALRLEPQARGR